MTMFRFTIRDVLWLTVVISILALWAMERRWVSSDWAKIHLHDGRLHDKINQQAAALRSQAVASRDLRSKIESERSRVRELERQVEELRSTQKRQVVEAELDPWPSAKSLPLAIDSSPNESLEADAWLEMQPWFAFGDAQPHGDQGLASATLSELVDDGATTTQGALRDPGLCWVTPLASRSHWRALCWSITCN